MLAARPELVEFLKGRFRTTDHSAQLAAGYLQGLLLRPLQDLIAAERGPSENQPLSTPGTYLSGLEKALRVVLEGK